MGLPRHREAAEGLRRRIPRDREHLFVFVTDRPLPPTNNVSKGALRPGVIFRKVTNGLRSDRATDTYAAFCSVVSTAKVNGRSMLGDLRNVLTTPSVERVAAHTG